jgi:hypothetical protein
MYDSTLFSYAAVQKTERVLPPESKGKIIFV